MGATQSSCPWARCLSDWSIRIFAETWRQWSDLQGWRGRLSKRRQAQNSPRVLAQGAAWMKEGGLRMITIVLFAVTNLRWVGQAQLAGPPALPELMGGLGTGSRAARSSRKRPGRSPGPWSIGRTWGDLPGGLQLSLVPCTPKADHGNGLGAKVPKSPTRLVNGAPSGRRSPVSSLSCSSHTRPSPVSSTPTPPHPPPWAEGPTLSSPWLR